MEAIRDLFERHGRRDYIGEEGISQLDHALQCAARAEAAGEAPALIVACLCHDVGHLLAFTGQKVELMGRYGVCQHELLGAAWLREQGFGLSVTAPVGNHVMVKRYKARDPAYVAGLSPASRRTLKYQGGPLTAAHATEFARDPHFAESCRLREYDNAAKVPGASTPPLTHFLDLVKQILAQK